MSRRMHRITRHLEAQDIRMTTLTIQVVLCRLLPWGLNQRTIRYGADHGVELMTVTCYDFIEIGGHDPNCLFFFSLARHKGSL